MGVTYQTVKLSSGSHKSPEQGVCVMELASMLAREPFSDHPTTACPVVASVLRAFNDALDDDPRQDLYGYAAKTVGSRGSHALERARMDRLIEWTEELEGHARRRSRFATSKRLRWLAPRPPAHVVAARAIKAVDGRRGDARVDVLAFVDELLALGRRTPIGTPESAWAGPAATDPATEPTATHPGVPATGAE